MCSEDTYECCMHEGDRKILVCIHMVAYIFIVVGLKLFLTLVPHATKRSTISFVGAIKHGVF